MKAVTNSNTEVAYCIGEHCNHHHDMSSVTANEGLCPKIEDQSTEHLPFEVSISIGCGDDGLSKEFTELSPPMRANKAASVQHHGEEQSNKASSGFENFAADPMLTEVVVERESEEVEPYEQSLTPDSDVDYTDEGHADGIIFIAAAVIEAEECREKDLDETAGVNAESVYFDATSVLMACFSEDGWLVDEETKFEEDEENSGAEESEDNNVSIEAEDEGAEEESKDEGDAASRIEIENTTIDFDTLTNPIHGSGELCGELRGELRINIVAESADEASEASPRRDHDPPVAVGSAGPITAAVAADGSVTLTTKFPDGRTVTTNPNGSMVAKSADGLTTKSTTSDGTIITAVLLENGTRFIAVTKVDGSMTTSTIRPGRRRSPSLVLEEYFRIVNPKKIQNIGWILGEHGYAGRFPALTAALVAKYPRFAGPDFEARDPDEVVIGVCGDGGSGGGGVGGGSSSSSRRTVQVAQQTESSNCGSVLGEPESEPETEAAVMECRICRGEEGILIQACACKGSVGLVHEECIQRWIKRQIDMQTLRLERTNRRGETVEFSDVKCEICMQKYNARKASRFNCTWRANRRQLCRLALVPFIGTVMLVAITGYTVNICKESLKTGKGPEFADLFIVFGCLIVMYLTTWMYWGAVQDFYHRNTTHSFDFSRADRPPTRTPAPH
jgi:hypothetical protein